MAERPDLEAIGNDLMEEVQDLANKSVASICRIQDLLAYCRELEAENKQLQAFYEAHRYMEEKDLGPKI